MRRRGAAEKAAGPGSLQIDCREGKFARPFFAPDHTRNSTTVLLYASLATPAGKQKNRAAILQPIYKDLQGAFFSRSGGP